MTTKGVRRIYTRTGPSPPQAPASILQQQHLTLFDATEGLRTTGNAFGCRLGRRKAVVGTIGSRDLPLSSFSDRHPDPGKLSTSPSKGSALASVTNSDPQRPLAVIRPRMNPISRPLLLPLTFPSVSELSGSQTGCPKPPDVVQVTCSAAEPSILVSWGVPCSFSEHDAHDQDSTTGIVMGCKDGSLYVFLAMPSQTPSSSLDDQSSEPNASRPTSPFYLSRHSRPTSRSASPSTAFFNQTPFHVAPRSRVVSGLSTEPVEAPKNFVDFEEEADKLKDMLKGKNTRDKGASGLLLPSNDKTVPTSSALPSQSSLGPVGPPPKKRRSGPRSLLSATNSPAFTPAPLSSPTSPALPPAVLLSGNAQRLSLKCHAIPSWASFDNPVTGMHLLNNNRLLVTLHAQGELSVFKTWDGTCVCSTHVDALSHPSLTCSKRVTHTVWHWTSLQVVDSREQLVTAFLVHAKADVDIWSASLDVSDDSTKQQSRLVMFECHFQDEYDSTETRLGKLGEWCFDSPVNGFGVRRDPDGDDILTLVYVNAKGHLVSRQVKLPPKFPLPVPQIHSQESNSNQTSLPLPNPFKSIMSRSAENISNIENKPDTNMVEPEECDMGGILSQGDSIDVQMRLVGNKLRGLAWSDQQLLGFESDGTLQQSLFSVSIARICDAVWVDDDHYAVILPDRTEVYALKTADANNDEVTPDRVLSTPPIIHSPLVHTFSLGPYQASHCISATEVLFMKIGLDNQRELRFAVADNNTLPKSVVDTSVIWKASSSLEENGSSAKMKLTSVLPLECNRIILGYDDGRLRQSTLSLMASQPGNPVIMPITSETAVDGSIIVLYSVQNERTKERFIIGGVDDGSISFWSVDSLRLCARWIVFTSSLQRVIQFQDEGPLRGCALCIAMDGTIAVIVIDGFQFLYLIPGAVAPLSRVCVNGDNLLLIYKDARARMWSMKTKEFWRSIGLDKAEELISQGGWSISSIDGGEKRTDALLSVFAIRHQGLDSVSTVLLDLEQFISDATIVAKSTGIGETRNRSVQSTLSQLRLVLSTLLTPSVSEDVDEICTARLGVTASHVFVGFSDPDCMCLYGSKSGRDAWCISPEVSAARCLFIVAVLRVMALFEELSEAANTVITFYATSLASAVGPSYQLPSLIFLAQRWFDGSNDIRQAARILFDSSVTHLSDEESIVLVEKLQHDLPSLQPTAERESLRSALALFICGHISAEKYSMLSAGTLTDIAKSIALYLHDEQSMYRVLAIDLSSRGFQVWQNYVDAMEILRALFTLATNASKQAISAQNVGAQARLAVLQIASSNTPLFITTMGLDILHPRSVDHRKSVLQIVAFLIRKRPLVLYPNLPRLMEAVVKSLDPNSTASREAVLDTATEILGHVVKTYPTVDFHMASQRLAVGTNEGAIVMYDLKTATRLFVLEGHQKRLSACSFSPDGRRLVTVSLEESVVLVWKVGSSFSSFFHPGAPPRQGSGGSSPFKTLSFNVGEEANMTVAETLELLHFEWIADRSVKLKIKEGVLTFST